MTFLNFGGGAVVGAGVGPRTMIKSLMAEGEREESNWRSVIGGSGGWGRGESI